MSSLGETRRRRVKEDERQNKLFVDKFREKTPPSSIVYQNLLKRRYGTTLGGKGIYVDDGDYTVFVNNIYELDVAAGDGSMRRQYETTNREERWLADAVVLDRIEDNSKI